MRAKSFFYVSLGILALALAYHLGATTATAQAPGNPIAAALSGGTVVTANGDTYQLLGNFLDGTWQRGPNVFSGAPTPAGQQSFGQLKAQYRK